MEVGLADQRSLRGRGRPAAQPQEAAPAAAPAAPEVHWFERIRDGRQIGYANNRDAAASETPAAGAPQPSQPSQPSQPLQPLQPSQPSQPSETGNAGQEAGASWPSHIRAPLAESTGRDTGLASPPWHQAAETAGQGPQRGWTDFWGDQPPNPSGMVQAGAVEPSARPWEAGAFQTAAPAPGDWSTTANMSPPARTMAPEQVETPAEPAPAEPLEPWETSWETSQPTPEEPWETSAKSREPWDDWEDHVHHPGPLSAVPETATPSSTQPQSHPGSAQDPASQRGSPVRPAPSAIRPSDDAWAAEGLQPQTAEQTHASESGGAPRTPVGPPAQCVKTFRGDDANFVPVECGDRMVLTHPEQNDLFGGHNLRTKQEGWLPSNVVGLPPEDRDPASAGPPPAADPVLNGHPPAGQPDPGEKEPVPVRVGMTVINSNGYSGTVVEDSLDEKTFKVMFGQGKVWSCNIRRCTDEWGHPLEVTKPVLNGHSSTADQGEAPVQNGVLNGNAASHSLYREPRQDNRWETFTDPNSNSLWFWHSESKEWFFGQNPPAGWTRFNSEGLHWWWHEDTQTFFFEKSDKPGNVGGS
ncbi:unnamed protein product [Symbiodinium natans]|uniref:SH3 domain-containing protein n=1 Tax=Symbiodinium natans TaxID=878477 RepID=A0A812KBA2_9DINO|nr:unnamed protein product [Symbiodinium natans]